MSVVTLNLDLPAGQAPAGAKVQVWLAGTAGQPVLGYVGGVQIVGEYNVNLDPNGAGRLDLVGNDLIEPSGTVWGVRIKLPHGPNPDVFYLDMPSTGGPYDVEAVLAEAPGSLPSAPLTAEIADRIAADTALGVRIDDEEADRLAGDALLIPLTQKGAANGVPTLDGTSHIPDAQIPSTIARDAEVTSAVAAAVSALVDSAPGALDTLNELAAALGDDANFASTVTAALAGKQPIGTYLSPPVAQADVSGLVSALAAKMGASDLGLFPMDFYAGADDDAKMLAALTAWNASTTGGTILLPPRAITWLNQVAIPNDGLASPGQKPLRIVGSGVSFSGRWQTPSGACQVDHQYSGAGSKIDTRGFGSLEITGVWFKDTSGGSTPFLHTTNTTVYVHDNVFSGSKARILANQDAIILGGTTATIGGTFEAPFQGYGSVIERNFFDKIRRAVHGQVYCNAVPIRDNVISASCGSNLGAAACAIDFDGLAPAACSGNEVTGNLIEMQGYVYGIRAYYSLQNYFRNSFFDPGTGTAGNATTLGFYSFEADARFNMVVDTFRSDTLPLITEAGNAVNTNTVMTPHQSQYSLFAQPVKFLSTAGPGVDVAEIWFTGGAGKVVLKPNAASANENVKLWQALRSAAESNNPSAQIAALLQRGEWQLGGTAPAVAFYDQAGTLLASVKCNAGSPEGVLAGNPGAICLDTDGKLWKKGSGTSSTGWVEINTGTTVTAETVTSTSYTAQLADAGKVKEMNRSGTQTVTLPPASSVAWPTGSIIEFCQVGVGQTVIAAGAGVTVQSPNGLKAARQWSSFVARYQGSDVWILGGDLTP